MAAGHHGLLPPILLHCRDDQRRPRLGPPRRGRETKDFLRNTYADIPAAVEALRQGRTIRVTRFHALP